jgi:hypothetical protein
MSFLGDGPGAEDRANRAIEWQTLMSLVGPSVPNQRRREFVGFARFSAVRQLARAGCVIVGNGPTFHRPIGSPSWLFVKCDLDHNMP